MFNAELGVDGGVRSVCFVAATARLVALLVFGALPASAQNLLANPHFDHDLSGWQGTSNVSFDPVHDANGSSSSGSAALVPKLPEWPAICQCVAQRVDPGVTFDFGGVATFPADRSPVAALIFRASVSSDSRCGAPSVADFLSSWLASPKQWLELRGQFVLPAGISGNSILFCGLLQASTTQGNVDDVFLEIANLGACTPADTVVCLADRRFQVKATYQASGTSGDAHALTSSDQSAYLWFFQANNPELVVKILNGCGLNQHYWVFISGLTDVGVTITVTDTATGAAKTYSNPEGRPFAAIEDTAALATCP